MKKASTVKPNRKPLISLSLLLAATLLASLLLFWGCDSNVPDSLAALRERNPETTDFVASYNKEHDKKHVIDLSDEYTPGTIPLFLQWDIRWGFEAYGGDFLALTGCGPTCLSMVAVGVTGNTTADPLTVANFADENGYYCQGQGSYWSLMSEGCQQFGLYSEELPLDETVITSALQSGRPIICAVGPGDFTTTGHFIVLTGINGDGTVNVNDPNSRIKSERTWDLQQIMHQIQNLWAFSNNE